MHICQEKKTKQSRLLFMLDMRNVCILLSGCDMCSVHVVKMTEKNAFHSCYRSCEQLVRVCSYTRSPLESYKDPHRYAQSCTTRNVSLGKDISTAFLRPLKLKYVDSYSAIFFMKVCLQFNQKVCCGGFGSGRFFLISVVKSFLDCIHMN